MIVSMTGVSGGMGSEALRQVLELDFVEQVRVLLTPKKKNNALARAYRKKYGGRVRVVRGWIGEDAACKALVEGSDLVVHMAAVIPPLSDQLPELSERANRIGTMRLTDAIAAAQPQPKFIHVSTVALYGNRTMDHPWGRVGDPLLPSAYDQYAKHKLFAERYVLESKVKTWAVLRQSAMLYDGIIFSNVSDGLMFHTTLNGPLEWVTARDSGYLIRRIVERDHANEVPQFWNKVYDIAGGAKNRRTGLDTFTAGFALMGGSPKKFFKPNDCATRNFHGVWYADNTLNDLFDYQREDVDSFWKHLGKKYRVFKLAKIVPAFLIRWFLFNRLRRNKNAPPRWVKDRDEGKIVATFGSMDAYRALPRSWNEQPIAVAKDFGGEEERPAQVFADKMLDHGFDESKSPEQWTIQDVRAAAKFRGGRLLSEEYSDPYAPLVFECSEGHTFRASAYTVMGAGHWCDQCMPEPWNYDALAKKSPYYAQVWYDSHSADENYQYWFEKNGKARYQQVGEKK